VCRTGVTGKEFGALTGETYEEARDSWDSDGGREFSFRTNAAAAKENVYREDYWEGSTGRFSAADAQGKY